MNKCIDRPNQIRSPIVALDSFASKRKQWAGLEIGPDEKANVVSIDPSAYNPDANTSAQANARSDFTVERIRDVLFEFGEKVHLVGHSNSACLGLKLALKYPELLSSLTIYEPTVFHLFINTSRSSLKLKQEIEHVMNLISLSEDFEASDTATNPFWELGNDRECWEQLQMQERQEFLKKAEGIISSSGDGISEAWALEDLKGLHIPVLVIMGMQSPLIVQNLAVQVVSALPMGRLTTLPMYGHFAPITNPEVINPLILEQICDVEQRLKGEEIIKDQPNGEQNSDSEKKANLLSRIRKSSFSLFT